MSDIFTKEKRSEVMSLIRGKDTKPEIVFRKALFNEGYRYRLHDRSIDGKPDLVLPRHGAVIFIHGCFWHGHEGCRLYRLPSSNASFWEDKVSKNRVRDAKVENILSQQGWRILKIWECSLRRKEDIVESVRIADQWLKDPSNLPNGEISCPQKESVPSLIISE